MKEMIKERKYFHNSSQNPLSIHPTAFLFTSTVPQKNYCQS